MRATPTMDARLWATMDMAGVPMTQYTAGSGATAQDAASRVVMLAPTAFNCILNAHQLTHIKEFCTRDALTQEANSFGVQRQLFTVVIIAGATPLVRFQHA
mmetsp:Transcript_146849/g.259539  ORF Transcript_146849/g.259539 Transcript_146849/m.259539 type:complete len:101 (+) Transcript_146849:633-935(+)